jgi:hypothetical protein
LRLYLASDRSISIMGGAVASAALKRAPIVSISPQDGTAPAISLEEERDE